MASDVVIFNAVFFPVLFISLIPAVVVYIFQSLALYRLASRRGVPNAWLAWAPVGASWILGALADGYSVRMEGKRTNRRLLLLLLSAATLLTVIPYCYSMITMMFTIESHSYDGNAVAMFVVSLVLFTVVAVLQSVFAYIAYYKVFKSCDPANAVLYLVLSIFFSIISPFLLFAVRNKDNGMFAPPPPAGYYPQPPVGYPPQQ